MPTKFYSTNQQAPLVNFEQALLGGLAPDKGLYMPELIPVLPQELIESFKDMEYHEIAYHIFEAFLEDTIPLDELKTIAKDAYNFKVPLEQVVDRKYILRLDQGPTASFKDFAARAMARFMQYFLKKENKKMLILVATSGDTGSAIANAYYGLDNIEVLVLFPEKEVSLRQRKQMTTLQKNIKVIALDGKFDDCQALVKQAFSDSELQGLALNSANSINFGRLLPQIVYYFYTYSRLANSGEEMVITVPSGNFGNMMGAVLASRMGLPVKKLVIATNDNDEFPVFMNTEKYNKIEPSRYCLSNAMNVGHPSNLARLIDIFAGQMDEKGIISKLPDLKNMRDFIFTDSVTDAVTKETIKSVFERYKVMLEPHGAVGWTVLEKYLEQEKNHQDKLYVVAETAHPAKFPDAIKEIISIDPELPESLKNIEGKAEKYDHLAADYQAFKKYLIENYQDK